MVGEPVHDVTTYMREVELGRFSVNDYRGLDDAPPFVVTEGAVPVVVSAPHAVSQWREGRVKPSDDFTGAIALAVAEIAGCSAIVASRYDACDPNWDPFERCAYKQALAHAVRSFGAVAVLDIHGVPSAAPDAIEVGSADGQTVAALPGADEFARDFLREQLAEHLDRQRKTISLNVRHAARGRNTVTNTIARACGVVALQLEIATPFRVPCNVKGHVPAGETMPFTATQLPVELASRRNPDPACVEATVRAIASLAIELATSCQTAGPISPRA